MDYTIREITEGEYNILEDFLYEAVFVPEGMPAPSRSIIKQPELQVYISDFGKKRIDTVRLSDAKGWLIKLQADGKGYSKFLEFVRNDNHYCRYYDGMFILFKTGLRISEFCGLTVSDIDLKGRKINVDHQLQRTRDMTYMIEDTKTTSGTRQVPMTDEVADAFKRVIANRKHCNILWDILILA